MSEDLIAKLKDLKNKKSQLQPDSSWLLANRARLLGQIKNTVNNESAENKIWAWGNLLGASRIFVPAKVFAVARAGVAVVLIGALTVSGWIASVSASYNSLPGEPMYQVKMATEKTELVVASMIGTDKDKVATLMKHATNRVDEYKRSKSSSQAKQAIQSLKDTIKTTNETLDKVGGQSPDKAIEVAKVVSEKSEQILEALTAEKPTIVAVETVTANATVPANIMVSSSPVVVVTNTASTSLQLNTDVAQATGLVEAASVKAVQVIVEKNIENNLSGTDLGQMKHEVEKKLDKVVSDLVEVNKDAAIVSNMIGVTTSISGDAALAVIPQTGLSVTSSEKDPVKKDTPKNVVEPVTVKLDKDAAEKIQGTEQKVVEANKTAEKAVAEAKTLINSNDLLGAIKKVQEIYDAKNDAKMIVSEAKQISTTIVDAAKSIVNASTTPSLPEKLLLSPATLTTVSTTATSTLLNTLKPMVTGTIDLTKPTIKK